MNYNITSNKAFFIGIQMQSLERSKLYKYAKVPATEYQTAKIA